MKNYKILSVDVGKQYVLQPINFHLNIICVEHLVRQSILRYWFPLPAVFIKTLASAGCTLLKFVTR
jgi:hypothetical protein